MIPSLFAAVRCACGYLITARSRDAALDGLHEHRVQAWERAGCRNALIAPMELGLEPAMVLERLDVHPSGETV